MQNGQAEEGLRGSISEKYVMVTFQSGIDYWKNCLKGFEDAAQLLNVSVEFKGATQYDVNEEKTVLEQVIARKPSGIAISAINSEALGATIQKAVDAGIPVVLFDSGITASRVKTFLGTNNHNAGATAADKMAELLNRQGKTAIITQPNQSNHQERTQGFVEAIEATYPGMSVIAIEDGKGDQRETERIAVKLLQEHPDLTGIFATQANGGVGIGNALLQLGKKGTVKVIGFDTDKGTLDMVKNGTISATMAQGTWNMGYWSMQYLFHLNHGLVESGAASRGAAVSTLPVNTDTGITIVTEANVDGYYAK
jgi:ribose transport system substrate-binding protein